MGHLDPRGPCWRLCRAKGPGDVFSTDGGP